MTAEAEREYGQGLAVQAGASARAAGPHVPGDTYGLANPGGRAPARPPQQPSSDKSPPERQMYFWLSVFALSALLVMCAYPLPSPFSRRI